MDTYVFGAAFFYAMLVLFVAYLFLFAAPSVARTLPYTLGSYALLSVDVWMFWTFFQWGLRHRQRRFLRSLGSLLLQLSDSVSLALLFVLMLREKCLHSPVCSHKHAQLKKRTAPRPHAAALLALRPFFVPRARRLRLPRGVALRRSRRRAGERLHDPLRPRAQLLRFHRQTREARHAVFPRVLVQTLQRLVAQGVS